MEHLFTLDAAHSIDAMASICTCGLPAANAVHGTPVGNSAKLLKAKRRELDNALDAYHSAVAIHTHNLEVALDRTK